MGYIVYFNVAAICIMAVVLLSGGIRKRLWDVQSKLLVAMLICNICLSITDIAAAEFMGSDSGITRMALAVTSYLYYVEHAVLMMMFYSYCRCIAGHIHASDRKKQILLVIPGVVMAVTMLSQFFANTVFFVDEQYVCRWRAGAVVIYLCSLLYEILGIVTLLKYKASASREVRISGSLFIFVSIFSMVAQSVQPEFRIETFGTALAILLFYLAMEKPEELIDADLDVFNQRAMLKLASDRFQTGENIHCIILKIHNLKVMHQTMGTDTVLYMLKQIADYLEENFETAHVFHFSQSMFTLMLDKKATDEDAKRVVAEIQSRFEKTWLEEKLDTRLNVHLAYVRCPQDATDMNTFINYLQYMRTNAGDKRGGLLYAADMDIEKKNRELCIRKIISDAVENRGFEVFYQPIFSVNENQIVSAEALIRLKDQSIGYVSPEEFIPIAEKNGMIMDIGEFVFESVCRFLHEENLKQYGIRFVEINLSVVQCMQDNLVERLSEIMERYQILSEQINLEITETAAIHTTEVLEENINKLHEKGICFSLDDYGSGYSNTDYLFRFPFHMVKIDKLILWEACKNEKAMIALKNTIQMIKELGLQVVVEGVETAENVHYLTQQHCDFLQGYYYSKPVPESALIEILHQMSA